MDKIYKIKTDKNGRQVIKKLSCLEIIEELEEIKDGEKTGYFFIKQKEDTSAESIVTQIYYGMPIETISQLYGISERTIYRRVEQYKREHPNEKVEKITRLKPKKNTPKKNTSSSAGNKTAQAATKPINKGKKKKKKKKRKQ